MSEKNDEQLGMDLDGEGLDGVILPGGGEIIETKPELSFAERVARTCHEVNRAYCEGHGDFTQVPWDEAPRWVHESCMQGVKYFHENPTATPEDMHKSWCKKKMSEGWKLGEEKDPLEKTHPNLVSYSKLPYKQRVKDELFLRVVKSFVTVG